MYGCSMEFTSKGKDFANIQSGICGITVTGLEDCVCGYQDFSNNSSKMRNIFLKSGVPPGSGHAYSFLSSSLFDPLAPENCNQKRKYCFNCAEHLSTLTEEVMVQRFPAFAFDYLYELEVPDDWIDKISTITSSFLEDSNWHESSTKTSSLPVIVDDDVLGVMEKFVPLRQYHLTLFKPVLRLSVADHSPYYISKPDVKKGKKRNFKSLKSLKNVKTYDALFSLEVYADCLDLQASTPMYPNKLVNITGNQSYPKSVSFASLL
ncbi:vacuolar protein sorting-associated protein 13B [Caerostris extrusa]|uniref:Vacuolar protein sorting-associated protein 13B n=1 Tax=Caerostris extrusa TaxID=172846 RepID=A0AAV4MIK6_CAEEX|nr:vacuolar protein sorting-associated protein 13B [Caerostris extrusa]